MENPHQALQCTIPNHKPNMREYTFFLSTGILISIPFTLFFAQAYDFLPAILTVVIFAPLIEEFAKVLPLFYRHGETERSILVLAILTGLGFGLSEFVLYVGFLGVPPLARLPGIIFHSSSAVIAAYGIAKKNPIPYYLTAVGLHMANNFLATMAIPFIGVVAGIAVLVTTYILAWQYYGKASKDKIVV